MPGRGFPSKSWEERGPGDGFVVKEGGWAMEPRKREVQKWCY